MCLQPRRIRVRLNVTKTFALVATMVCMVLAADKPMSTEEAKIPVGIIALEGYGFDESSIKSVNADLASVVNDVGFYTVFDQEKLLAAFATIKQTMPNHCLDPRCVLAVGQSLKMSRMLFGTIDKNSNSYGVNLTLLDVESRQTIATATLASEAGISSRDLLAAAVAQLHGQGEGDISTKTKQYFGREVNNLSQMLISSAATAGAGLIWGIASGAITTKNRTQKTFPDELSGIPTSTYLIPMFARPAALGNAYVALSDDAYGVLYNPAGLAFVPMADFATGYQYRFGITGIGAAYANKATRDLGFGQGFLYTGDEQGGEMYFVTAAAYKFNQLLPFLKPISIGAALKLSSINHPAQELSTASENTFGYGVDIGVQWQLADHIRSGLLIRDAASFMHVYNGVQDYSYTEMLPPRLQVGGSYLIGYSTVLLAEFVIPVFVDQQWKISGGIEQEIFRFLRARVGIQKELYFDKPIQFTGGLGIKISADQFPVKQLMLDASYEYNTNEIFSNVMNLSFKAGF